MLHTNCHTRWRTSLACIWHPFIPDWRPVLKCTVRILGSRRIHMHTRGLFVTTERQQFFFPQRNVTNHELSSPGRGGESPFSAGEFDVYLKTHASHHITSQPGLIECACLRVARPRASILPQSMPLIVRSTQESSYAQPVCNASLTFDYFGSLQRSASPPHGRKYEPNLSPKPREFLFLPQPHLLDRPVSQSARYTDASHQPGLPLA